MYSISSFLKNTLTNIWEVISCSELRMLRKNDEYAFLNFDEHLSAINSRRCLAFSFLQIIIGVVFFVISFISESASLFVAIGSVLLIASSIFFILYYKNNIDIRRYDKTKGKVLFYIFWNVFSVAGFMITADFYIDINQPYVFLLFLSLVVAVPVFETAENLVAFFIYFIPVFYYGMHNKCNVYFFIFTGVMFATFFWINSLKLNSVFNEWASERKIKDALERNRVAMRSDGLTGMLNRTGLVERVKEKYSSNSNYHSIAVITFDVDNFRLYNHKYGYERSDNCLYNISNCIKIIAKPVSDIIARLDGDRFAIVVEDMSELEVIKFAEQIRVAVETMAIPFHEDRIVTISIGVSEICDISDISIFSKLICQADLQLMIAKNNGKNCIGYRNRAFIQENRRKS